MEAEEKICVRFYEQLENMRKKLQSLPVSEAVSKKCTNSQIFSDQQFLSSKSFCKRAGLKNMRPN